MDIEVQAESDHVIVRPSGSIDAINSPALQEAIDDVMKDSPLRVIIDLESVPYISSNGLRVFIVSARKLPQSGSMAVCNLKTNVRQMFELAGFDKILTICDGVAEARQA